MLFWVETSSAGLPKLCHTSPRHCTRLLRYLYFFHHEHVILNSHTHPHLICRLMLQYDVYTRRKKWDVWRHPHPGLTLLCYMDYCLFMIWTITMFGYHWCLVGSIYKFKVREFIMATIMIWFLIYDVTWLTLHSWLIVIILIQFRNTNLEFIRIITFITHNIILWTVH